MFRSRVWLPAIEAAGLAPLRFHDLRHTCADILVNEFKAHPLEVSRYLGHSSITVTMDRYGHLWKDALEALADKVGDLYEANLTAQRRPRAVSGVTHLPMEGAESSL